MGITIVMPLSMFMADLLSAPNEMPCAIPNKIKPEAATCSFRKPMYRPAMTAPEIANAFPI